MTLIACIHPSENRALLGDILLSSTDGDPAFIAPSRAYLSPQSLREMKSRPQGFIRKVIEVTPTIAMLWSGNYGPAAELARRARDWFTIGREKQQDVIEFLEEYYRNPIPNFSAIIASGRSPWWIYYIGPVVEDQNPFFGPYAVAGTGTQLFRGLTNQILKNQDSPPLPDTDSLRVTSELMAREVFTSEPLHSQFGAGYEILYAGLNGFERVDDVMHMFCHVQTTETGFSLFPYSYVLRQWYEADRFYVGSLATPESQTAGLGPRVFVAPDILGQTDEPLLLNHLPLTPRYFCMHHLFIIDDEKIPSVLTMKGDGISTMITISRSSDQLSFEFSPEYLNLLRERAAGFRQAIKLGKHTPAY